jgi:hypothetical protein
MQWNTDDEVPLGPKQHLTPEGFLVAKDVPLARVGVQQYHPSELQMLDGMRRDRMIEVERTPDQVFDPASIASFQGKPVVDDHPFDMVGPDNWQQHAIGHVVNVRRGDPPDDDVLLGDLVFTSRRGIELVRNGKRSVSVGYDAHYEPTGPSTARQLRIRANHIALVDEGRCGPRCMIGDAKPDRRRQMMRAKHTSDQETIRGQYRETLTEQATEGGTDPGSPSGARLIMLLPGPVSAYFIANAEGDNTGLFRSSDVDRVLDPGRLNTGTGFRRMTGDALKAISASDAKRCRKTLAGINAANRKYWEQNGAA